MVKIQINTIGLDKKPKECHVVVAMSGGVDSSTVAGMMKQEGYNVTGITLKLYDDGKISSSISSKTDYLVLGNKAGNKLKKAQDNDVTILTEDDFYKLINNIKNT